MVKKACHVAVGMDRKQVLSLWLGTSDGAKFWVDVLTESVSSERPTS